MSDAIANHRPTSPLPPRQHLLGIGLMVYFVALLVAPVLVPPLLAVDGSTSYPTALQQVLVVDLVGYLVGLAAVLR